MKKPRFHSRPEAAVQRRVIEFLEARGWLVEVMHGNAFQKGIPDLFLWHPHLGFRWVDVKLPKGSVLTKAQCQKWPKWEEAGLDIHIMVDATEEEYQKLFGPANWREMWKPRYDEYLLEIEDIIQEILEDGEEE
jgi:hypothetical protein